MIEDITLHFCSLFLISPTFRPTKPRLRTLSTLTAPLHIDLGAHKPSVEGFKFPATYFLDPKVFWKNHNAVPTAILPVRSSIAELIGDVAAQRDVAVEYFDTIHIWMPFISKKRFLHWILSPLAQPRADVALLVLCMKLVTWLPSQQKIIDNPENLQYLAAKQFLLELEVSGTLTLQVAQACILLTIYELGHAIYPSAYMSVGTCSRYVMALGINGKAKPHTTDVTEWLKHEESRRAWWSTIILERFALCILTGSIRSLCNPR